MLGCLLPLLLSAVELGPLTPAPAVAVYFVADGTATTVTLTLRQGARPVPPRLMVRLFDPDEVAQAWHYLEYVPAAEAAEPYTDGITLRDEATAPGRGEMVLTETFTLERPGVWQLRVTDGAQSACAMDITLSRDLPWGYSCQNGDFTPLDPDRESWYAWVPPRATRLAVSGAPPAIEDEAGRVLQPAGAPPGALEVERAEQVWRFRASPPAAWKFRVAGFPLILCPSPEAARAIQASVMPARGGLIVCHQAQAEIAALLPDLLARCGETDELLVPVTSRREAWLAEPVRNRLLTQSYLATIPALLPRQNLDPDSPFAGSLDGWQELAAARATWNRLAAVEGLWGGLSSRDGGAAALALAATRPDPPNPWYGQDELLYRAAAAALADLLMVGEDETFWGISDLDPYPGHSAFVLGQKTFPVYEIAAPHLPESVRAVWTAMLRRLVERSCVDYLTSARNQSSHYLVAYQAFANGSGDPLFRDLARVFARRWLRGQSAAGYHMEATGPCGSYIGMTHWHEAVYYRQSGDAAMLDSLRRSYTFFNHTVAPEPDGRLLGGFNFNHRVGEGFYGEQWSGARGILDDLLPEVGLWATPDDPGAEPAAATAAVRRFLDQPTVPLYADIATPRFLWAAPPDRSGAWPATSPTPFVKNFADELIAVRRPGYYATIYVGHPAAADLYIRGREKLRQPFAGQIEDVGGELPNMRQITPFVGGGLSGFWTPAFGHGVMAANWSPTTHHGLIATLPDGRRTWEDYFENRFALDEAAETLTIEGQVELLPLSYTRQYHFAPDHLEVELTLTATAACETRQLVENLPLLQGEWKARGASLTAAGQATGLVQSDRARLADTPGAGLEVVFEQPETLHLLPDGLRAGGWRKLAFGRLEIALPAAWTAGQTHRLRYRLVPFGG